MDQFETDTKRLAARFANDPRLQGVDLVIEQRVVDDGITVANYHVILSEGSMVVEAGPARDPDVVIQQDSATAMALRTGDLHAQRAFLTGRLNVDGDIGKLLDHGELLIDLMTIPDA